MQLLRRLAIGVMALFLLTPDLMAMSEQAGDGATPPRLSLIEGPVSFWRHGASDWTVAALNTPLAPGDTLFAGEHANLEVQIGSRAFVRAGERTQFGLVNRQRDYLQFRVADGEVSFDLRALPPGLTVEVDTPNAAFTIERTGYYRLNVDKDTSLFISRNGGRATVIPAGGQARGIAPSEELVVEGTAGPSVESYMAPEPDVWDGWNTARTDRQVDALSARYLPSDVYGADSLDRHGDWRMVPEYGAVWVPAGLPVGWAPYSSGQWIWDPFYGWTWIDDAPWGWAPFHYGRWVYLNGFWGWTPGSVAEPTVYSPALVAFFSAGGASARIDAASPALSWVALSWGEPVIPWWGRRGFIGVPSWQGWSGPRMVNNVAIRHGATVNVANIAFRNTRVTQAVIAVRHDQFGRGSVRAMPTSTLTNLTPIAGALPVKPSPASLTAGPVTPVQPNREVLSRPAVTVRPPREAKLPWRAEAGKGAETQSKAAGAPELPPELKFVPPPKPGQPPPALFGTQAGPERSAPLPPLRYQEGRRPAVSGAQTQEPRLPPVPVSQPGATPHEAPRRDGRADELGGRSPEARQNERGREEGRALPGDPANRMSPKHHGMDGKQRER